MTLKEKFEPFVFYSLGNNSMERKYQIEDNAKECEKIADDYAVEFKDWVEKLRNSHLDSLDFNLYLDNDTKQLLEIFKKEQGL